MENVFKLSDYTVKTRTERPFPRQDECKHMNTVMDDAGYTVRCEACDANLSPYWVLKRLLNSFDNARKDLELKYEQLKSDSAANITSKAAKNAQSAWREKHMVPTCPHCHRGIMASDGFGQTMMSKELELKLRKKHDR